MISFNVFKNGKLLSSDTSKDLIKAGVKQSFIYFTWSLWTG